VGGTPSRKNILIVDDSLLIRHTLSDLLEKQDDWVIEQAVNGQDVVDQVQRLAPDLVVLDFSMPLMNGLEAGRILRKLLPSLPLIMFTNFQIEGHEGLNELASSAGFNAVASKSGDPATLVNLIHWLLEPVA